MSYLDHAATTAPRREVIEAMWPWLTQNFGNASSHHERGQRAARALDDARERIAAVLGAGPSEIIFTSGGTEADNLAVKGIASARRQRRPELNRVLVSSIEHDAVLESARSLAQYEAFTAVELPVDSVGFVSPDTFRAALAEGDAARPGSGSTPGSSSVAVASVMLANNEVGTVQNIPELARIAAEFAVPLHTDAVQSAATLPLDVNELGVSALSLAGHKFGTPQGIGLLWVKRGTPLRTLMSGGGQERGRRSGTSNVAGAVGLATALQLAEREREEYTARVTALRDRLIDGILGSVPGALLTGPNPRDTGATSGLNGTLRLPNNAFFCFPGVNGETVLVDLENQGVLVSSGSACATGSSEPSHVLTALGVPAEVATTSVRFSLGRETSEANIDNAIRATAQIIARLRGGAH
ncbi:cysteine desulfurase [Kocuria sp. cx-116]|uniref:cysteine desulfurase family protein n=1 Tax=Kocuria sp. cx-116 TaxID=2771378 RepID=UPI0016837537|nr:cysteine desulfurase family protein [Kocuria sp. cx-116]MBD2762053.1 cysteine desulfurase [Kocuria sp. cx-116]